ncbi:hypothetical protein XENOCAPTIV_011048 [Xenoophorus captivus]|uniref:Uncharacterized protein n=1 Tax=Xenoophorus captivus TaxID=1517983 RepID=A0ABV0S6V3_9TELE
MFNETVEGTTWFISSKNIYVAPEGVAASVDLTPEQAEWYLMSDEAVPHVSLSLHLEHQAKELGGVVKCSLVAGDWQDTSVTNLRHSKSTNTYCIKCTATNKVLLQQEMLTHHHGREKTDHPEAAALLQRLPSVMG